MRRFWSVKEIEELKEAYKGRTSEDINVISLSIKLSRTVDAIHIKASKLGLGNKYRQNKKDPAWKRPTMSREEQNKLISINTKKWIAKNGHPRGALGMKHSEENKRLQSERAKKMMAKMTKEQLSERSYKAHMTRIKNGNIVKERKGCTWKSGWRNIGGIDKYYRSRWEANYARYLQWLKDQGKILDWLHEPMTFWFEDIKRGSCSYLPDFMVTELDGRRDCHEVKGWMDTRSATKLKRMKKYHPSIKVVLIQAEEYKSIEKTMKHIIEGWE